MSTIPQAPPRGSAIALLAFGALALAVTVPLGPKAAVIGGLTFFFACVLAVRDTTAPVFTWLNALYVMIAVIWLIPSKVYTLPINLPVEIGPYRLVVLLLVFVLFLQLLTGSIKLDAAGHGKPLALLGIVALVSTVLNYTALGRAELDSPLKPVTYFLSFLLVYMLVSTTVTKSGVEAVVRAIVIGGLVVATFALYESFTRYNFFEHLQQFIPVLEYHPRDEVALRAGRLRVRASSQHPIALGAALMLVVPLALYLASRAASRLGRILWLLAAGIVVTAAATTISRTTVMMAAAMTIAALLLRGRALLRHWPVLLILPVFIHFVSPGTIGALRNSLFPEGGLVSDVTGRAGEHGSGRFTDIGPGVRIWTRSPIVGHGLGSQSVGAEDPVRGIPASAVIYDNQYMSTLVALGALGIVGTVWLTWGAALKLLRSARRRAGPASDLSAACGIACAGFATSMFFFDAFAFTQVTLVFCIIAAIGLRGRQDASDARVAAGGGP